MWYNSNYRVPITRQTAMSHVRESELISEWWVDNI